MGTLTLGLEFMYVHLVPSWRPAWGSEGFTAEQVQRYTSSAACWSCVRLELQVRSGKLDCSQTLAFGANTPTPAHVMLSKSTRLLIACLFSLDGDDC